MCAAVLSLEAITLGLTTPVLVSVAGIAIGPALAIGLGLALLCILAAGMLRHDWAYVLGYVIQVAAIAMGVVIAMMFVLGAAFGALWVGADLLGRRIERERAEAWAAWQSEQA